MCLPNSTFYSTFAAEIDRLIASMSIDRYDREDLQAALRVLRNGGLIAYPTDTIWGIGCDATNSAAVERLFALKQRADSKAMLMLLDSSAKLPYYIENIPETAWMLLDSCEGEAGDEAAKALTIVYPNARNIAPKLIAEDGSVGIRITHELFSKALCAQLRHPLVSTSANISGQPSPRFFAEISQDIIDGVDYVCQFRREDESEHAPSTIIKLNNDGTFKIIRP